LEREVYDYTLEQHGIILRPLSSYEWVGRPQGLSTQTGRLWLQAFLEQLAAFHLSRIAVTNLQKILPRIEELLPAASASMRRPLISLYLLYNRFCPEVDRSPNMQDVIGRYHGELTAPSVEALVVSHLSGCEPSWAIDVHRSVHDKYYRRRNNGKSLRMPALFEAGITVELAERYRSAGQQAEALSLISFAVENFPSWPALATLEKTFDPACPIDSGVLLPSELKNPSA
jgi:hypothetical protein